MNLIKESLKYKTFFGLVALLVLQQIVASSSVVWLAEISRSLSVQAPVIGILTVYIGSLLFPYFFGTLSLRAVTQWDLRLQGDYYRNNFGILKDRPVLWRQNSIKVQQTSLLAKEGPLVISQWTQYVHETLSLALNVGLNILTITIVIDSLFAGAYALSLFLMLAILRYTWPHNSTREALAQRNRLKLSRTLLSFWDNVVLGNRWFSELWSCRFQGDYDQFARGQLSVTRLQHWSSCLMAVLTIGPSAVVVIYLFGDSSRQLAQNVALLAVLPRLFFTLNYTHSLLLLVLRFSSEITRMKGIYLAPPESRDKWNVHFDLIRMTKDSQSVQVSNWDQLLALTKSPGRITIRGRNGSGKSSLLLRLKEALAHEAVYLPAQHELEGSLLAEGASTGERAVHFLRLSLGPASSKVILLDEWDANLDTQNCQLLDQLIDEAAKQNLVIEVRHN